MMQVAEVDKSPKTKLKHTCNATDPESLAAYPHRPIRKLYIFLTPAYQLVQL